MEIKMAWKYGDCDAKLEFEKLIDDKINGIACAWCHKKNNITRSICC